MEHKKYIILGGGVTGLIANHYINDRDCIIIERNSNLGGASTRQSSLGGIRMLADSTVIEELMQQLQLPVYKCEHVIGLYWQGQYHNILDAARSLDMFTILNDYCRKTRKQSYYDIPDAEKISIMSGIEEKKILYEERIPFIGGLDYMINKLIMKASRRTLFNKEITSIEDKSVILSDGMRIGFDYLISTIPLPVLLEYMGTPITLNYNPIRFLNIRNDSPYSMFFKDGGQFNPLYIYFPQLSFPFHRISFPHRTFTLGGGISEMLVETVGTEKIDNDIIWNALTEAGLLPPEGGVIVEEYIQNMGHFHYREGAQESVDALEEFDVYAIGRYGEWNHNSNISTATERIKGVVNDIKATSEPKTHV